MHIYLWQINPLAIMHRCLECHCTKLGRSIYIYTSMHIYLWQIDPPCQLSIDVLNTTTPGLADLYIYMEQCIYTHGRLTLPVT